MQIFLKLQSVLFPRLSPFQLKFSSFVKFAGTPEICVLQCFQYFLAWSIPLKIFESLKLRIFLSHKTSRVSFISHDSDVGNYFSLVNTGFYSRKAEEGCYTCGTSLNNGTSQFFTIFKEPALVFEHKTIIQNF